MNPNVKRFLIIFTISVVVHFPLFYLFEEDKTLMEKQSQKMIQSF